MLIVHNMSFRPLKDLLSRSVRSAGIADQVEAAQVLELCRQAVSAVLPAAVASQVLPLSVRHGAITLQVSSPALANELRLRQTEILSHVNRNASLRIERLQYRVAEG